MPNPSYYFNLFKKFQVLDHVSSQSVHGNPGAPTGGFNLNDPNSPFNATFIGGTPITVGDFVPANNPLWAILNARAMGVNPFPASVVIPGGAQAGTGPWPAMPPGPTNTGPFAEFQTNAPVKLLDVFANWITGHQVRDIPTSVIAAKPPPLNVGLDPGVALFVCSMPGDTGVRPGVPPNFWATSLISLVDPNTGNTVNPASLTAAADYNLVAVIGNRGNAGGGRYLNHPPAIEAAASVMVWNSFDSPGVELPALSNLDVNSNAGLYEQYFLRPGDYDIAGWHLNVQTVFNGIIAALTDAVNKGLNLGGLSPRDWVLAQPAHLCAKVVIRGETINQPFPIFGVDTPDTNRRIAQKNLAPFDAGITATDPNPNIIWKNFIVGQPLFFRVLKGEGKHRLVLNHQLPAGATQVFIAVPAKTFEEHVRTGGGLRGLEVVPDTKLPQVGRYRGKPFPDAVILQQTNRAAEIQLPQLEELQYLGMALGIEYDREKLRDGPLGDLTIAQHSILPVLKPGTRSFDLEEKIVGGFTLQVRATDAHAGPRGRIEFPEN
jgi:hypothetical protein